MADEVADEPDGGEETLIPAFDRQRLKWRRIIAAAGDKRGNKNNFSSSHQRSTNRNNQKRRNFRACEICNANGLLRCGRCQNTYYCTVEHQEFDFLPLHSVVCEELGRIRGDEQMMSSLSKEALHNLAERKEELARKCIALGRNYLAVGKFESAIPTGLLTIKLLRDIFGSFAEELLEPYLTLTLAALGMADIRIAKEFFALARLVYQKKSDPVTDSYVRSRFLRVWSRVAMFDGKQMDSCYMAAKDIYHWTMQLGLHHIKTAFGYFTIGINYWILDDKRRAKENLLQAVLITKQTLYDVIVRLMDVYDAAASFDKQPIHEAMRERGYENIDADERDELMLILHTTVCIYGRQAHQHLDVFPAVYYAIAYLNILNMNIHRGLLYFARAAQSAAGAPNDEIVELFSHIDSVYEQIKRRDKSLIDGTDPDENFEIGQEYQDESFVPMRNSLWQIIKHFDDVEEARRRERDAALAEAEAAAGTRDEVARADDEEFAKLLEIEGGSKLIIDAAEQRKQPKEPEKISEAKILTVKQPNESSTEEQKPAYINVGQSSPAAEPPTDTALSETPTDATLPVANSETAEVAADEPAAEVPQADDSSSAQQEQKFVADSSEADNPPLPAFPTTTPSKSALAKGTVREALPTAEPNAEQQTSVEEPPPETDIIPSVPPPKASEETVTDVGSDEPPQGNSEESNHIDDDKNDPPSPKPDGV